MATLQGWVEGVIFALIFVIVSSLIVSNMNILYNQNNDLGLTDNTGAQQSFIQYGETSKNQLNGGEVQFDAQSGITLKSSYGLTIDVLNIIWKFLSGGFIQQLVASWGLGESGTTLAFFLQILYVVSLGLIILGLLFKSGGTV